MLYKLYIYIQSYSENISTSGNKKKVYSNYSIARGYIVDEGFCRDVMVGVRLYALCLRYHGVYVVYILHTAGLVTLFQQP